MTLTNALEKPDDYVTLAEAARMSGLSEPSLRGRVARKRLASIRRYNVLLVPAKEIKALALRGGKD